MLILRLYNSILPYEIAKCYKSHAEISDKWCMKMAGMAEKNEERRRTICEK